MRISDWSSDVCSSDLLPYTIGEYLADAFPFALRTARRLPADHKCTPFRDRTEAGPRERLSKPHANSNFLASDHISRSEEHTSELQSLMRTSYAVFCLKKKKYSKSHSRPIIHPKIL